MSKKMVGFRASEQYLKKIEQLSEKLKLDFSNTVRLSVDKMLEKYLNSEEEILLVDNEQWNKMVGVKLEKFLGNITQFKETLEALTPVLKGANVQKDIIDIPESDLSKWIDTALTDDRDFETKDIDPEAQKAKEMILKIVRKCKGRID